MHSTRGFQSWEEVPEGSCETRRNAPSVPVGWSERSAFKRPDLGEVSSASGSPTAKLLSPMLRVMAFLLLLLVLRYVVPATLEEFQFRLTRGRQRAEHEISGPALGGMKLQDLSTAYQLVSQRVGPSVVHIETRSGFEGAIAGAVNRQFSVSPTGPASPHDDLPPGERQEQGSGVVVDADGYIVTNYHVVAQAQSMTVTLSDGRRVDAHMVGHDWLTDLAVLKVRANGLTAAEWGDSDLLQEGALVWAVGTPYGLKRSITAGIVSAKSLAGIAGSAYQDYLQTDAAVNPGSSGGPLVDVHGQVVGINTAILGESYRGISFAVPSNIVQSVYRQIRAGGRVDRGWLGVKLDDVPQDRPSLAGPPPAHGAMVGAVGVNSDGISPATAAGLEPGDIIIRWGPKGVDRPETLVREIADTLAGSRVEVEVLRRGERLVLEVTVGRRPDEIN